MIVIKWIRGSSGRPGPGRLRILLATVAALTIFGAVAVPVIGQGLFLTPPTPQVPPERSPISQPDAVTSAALSAAELAPCHAQLRLEDVEAVVRLERASDFGIAFPATANLSGTGRDSSAPAYVVVFKDRYPIEALRRAAPPPGETWPPQPTLAPGFRDVCLVIPSGIDGIYPKQVAVIYGDIDITGFQP